MVVGNGYFSDTIDDAVEEMKRRTRSEVQRVPYPTIGNITYYAATNGTVFGVQAIASRYITREKKPVKYKQGYSIRISKAPHKEDWVRLSLIMYNTFVAKQWTQTELTHTNGNVYDVSLTNLSPKREKIPPEYAERMNVLKEIYTKHFRRVADYCVYNTGIAFEDARDVAQNAFIYLSTNGWTKAVYMNEDFVGLWKKIAKLRSYDFLHMRWRYDEDFDSDYYNGSTPNLFEFDLTEHLPGQRAKDYLRMCMQGYTPTETARLLHSTLANVSSSNTRSIQFLRRYLRNECNI